MYLKSLEIQGFKSFANKTVFSFLPPHEDRQSITVVIGPNGSGKSNVVDAIRWVMGEQSLKTLRGKKSEDVIFAGSEHKGKLGMASVTLTIDNAGGGDTIDYEDIVLTRRLYRDGESEYIVNGQPSRLLDIQLLLARAQFGQGSYSIVGQGMIDRMLLQTAAERKAFFDEASGIKELQIKYHQAVLKLSRTREHVAQAELLLQEIAPRLKLLSRQVKKLEERQSIEEELREVQETYYASLAAQYGTELSAVEHTLSAVVEHYTREAAELQAVQTELATLAREASRETAFAELTAEYQRVGDEKTNLERERAVMDGKLQVEYARSGKQALAWLEEKIAEVRAREQGIVRELEGLRREETAAAETLARTEADLNAATLAELELRQRLTALEHAATEAKQDQQFFHAIGLRAVQAILESGRQFGEVYGAVASLAEADSRYQLALDTAAGGHVSSLVVADDRVAERCIQYLRSHELGVATFLPLTTIRPRSPRDVADFLGRDGVYGRAVDLLTFDERFQQIFSFVFGSTLVVEDMNVARAIGIGRIRMVTLLGDLVEENGSLKGGFRRQRASGFSFSHREHLRSLGDAEARLEETDRVRSELDVASSRVKALEEEVRRQVSARQVQQRTIELIEKQLREASEATAGLEQERALQTMSPDEYTAAMETLAKARDGVNERLDELGRALAAVERKILRFQHEEEEKKRRIFDLQTLMQQKQEVLNAVSEKKNQANIDRAKWQTKLEDLEQELYQELHITIASLTERGIPVAPLEALENLQTTMQKLKYKLGLIGGIDESVMAEYAETSARHEALMTELTDLEKAGKDLDSLVIELDEMMQKKRERAFRSIRKEFRRFFAVLFEGGQADLTEVYGDAPTDDEMVPEGEEGAVVPEPVAEEKEKKPAKQTLVGIDITASPPGKKVNNIQALSGGERTLTSIALICAILATNPSPFVLLDEVEAALDEANTLRFTGILRELARSSQFILITHNRATMHVADALYGVTMGGEGVSQLVSVKVS